MLTEAFLLTPYLAIAASLSLAGVVTAVCASRPVPKRTGFSI